MRETKTIIKTMLSRRSAILYLCCSLAIVYPIKNVVNQSRVLATTNILSSKEQPQSETIAPDKLETRLSPLQHGGSWIGSTWIPPMGWRYYSPTELQTMFGNKSVLWFGDSTARRAAMTMYTILNSTNAQQQQQELVITEMEQASILDKNKKETTDPCTRFPKPNSTTANTGILSPSMCYPMPARPDQDFMLLVQPCLESVIQFAHDESNAISNLTAHVDVMILSLGVWYGERPRDCYQRNRTAVGQVHDAVQALGKLLQVRPHLTIVWRTSGWSSSGKNLGIIRAMNTETIALLDENKRQDRFRVVDWGSAVEPRSFGMTRIHGDIKAHYGFEPRHVLIQMIANVLSE